MEFVRHANNITIAHHRVSGMNFIPDGYTIPATIQDARAKAKSQLVASGAAKNKTEPPSHVDDNE